MQDASALPGCWTTVQESWLEPAGVEGKSRARNRGQTINGPHMLAPGSGEAVSILVELVSCSRDAMMLPLNGAFSDNLR